jgi:hypothetical protein
MTWEEPERIGLYVTHLDEAVERFARDTVRGFREEERAAIVYDNLLRAMELFDAPRRARGCAVPRPGALRQIVPGRPVLDTVRLPRETLRLGSGDSRRPGGRPLRGAAREHRHRHCARGRVRPRFRDVRHRPDQPQPRAARPRPAAAARRRARPGLGAG